MTEVEAMAEAYASLEGRLSDFERCKANPELDQKEGSYQGYLADAAELIARLDFRGFRIVPKENRE